ncbi:WWE domain protein [Ostertagia ostertagi]
MAEEDDDECPICAQKMILPTAVPGCGHKFCFLCIKGAAFRTQERLCPMCRGNVSTSIFRSPAMRNITIDMHDPESPTVAEKPSRPKSDCSGPPCKQARVCSDEPGPSTSTETREQSNEQDSKQLQQETRPSATSGNERYYWLYKGRGGWWRFDPRLEKDLESGRQSEKNTVELLICGFKYEVDFERMVQYRVDGPTRTRKIKRVSDEEFREMSNKGMLKGISGVRLAQN